MRLANRVRKALEKGRNMHATGRAERGCPLQVHLGKKLPNGERRAYDISEEEFHELSFMFQCFTGAMLANIVNTAVIMAGREGRTTIVYHDLTQVRHADAWAVPPLSSRSSCAVVSRAFT
jgi:hypothetical protein